MIAYHKNPYSATQIQAYLDLFTQRVPHKPYATDDPSRGVRIMPARAALRRSHIQIGRYPHAVFRLVLDVDHPGADHEGRPGKGWLDRIERVYPSLVVVNPENMHAHLFYEFQDPIPVSAASQKTLELLADVEARLERFFRADPRYPGLIAKNPVWWWENYPDYVLGDGKTWKLSDLAAVLRDLVGEEEGEEDEEEAAVSPAVAVAGYGRNCTLFDAVRFTAYRHVKTFRKNGDQNGFRSFLDTYARHQNQVLFSGHPKGPLDPREVRHIVKSVVKFTWNKFKESAGVPVSPSGRVDRSRVHSRKRGHLPPPLSPEEQEKVRQANNEARQREAREKLATAYQRLLERGEEITVRGLAREARVSRQVAREWLREVRGTPCSLL